MDMKKIVAVAGLLVATMVLGVQADTRWQGALAPTFELPDQDGDVHKLSEYRGRWLVLYFYPKDKTPGCTIEAQNFGKSYAQFQALDAEIVGVSLDDVESHKEFAEIHKLPFPLLADPEREAARAYDVLTEIGPLKYTRRETFVIDPDGVIVRHYEDVDHEIHARQLLEDLPELKAAYQANPAGESE